MKRTLNDDLTHVGILDSRIRESTEKIAEYSDEKRKLLSQIREAIRSGETTGNKIDDFIIAKYGDLNHDYSKSLNDLEKRLKGKVGQYVLLVKKEIQKKEFINRRGFSESLIPPPSSCSLKTDFFLGLISSDSLYININFNLCYVSIIGNKMICFNDIGYCRAVISELVIVSSYVDNIPSLSNVFSYEGNHRAAEFFVGDEEVKKLFCEFSRYEEFFLKADKLLDKNLGSKKEEASYLKFCHKV